MLNLLNNLFYQKMKMLIVLVVVFAVVCCPVSASLASDEDSLLAPLYKNAPLGFGRMLQPNVLLLLDTSGSMTFRMDSNNSTYGDGTKPYNGQIYFGRDHDSDNNDPNVDYNYHPLLEKIDPADLPDNGRDYLGKYGDDYYYPNDSRLYQLKLVLWEILEDPAMTAGLNLGMSTYYQYKNNYSSSWYTWLEQGWWGWYWDNQIISWSYSGDRASLKVPFGSTDDIVHMEELKSWIDGEEGPDNPELRANGHTPLGDSIYDISNDYDSAKDFFFDGDNGAITNWCQDNWLIVLTDGQETGGGDPVQAVKNLHDYAETSGWVDNFGEKAQPVKTFVIGLLSPDDMSEDLIDDLNDMADYGDDGEDNNSAQAYFVNDVETLLESFRDIFRIIQVRSGAGGAPLVSPARLEGESTAVYVSTFVPKQEMQWQGDLTKYTLSGDILPETPDWSAAEQLNSTAYDSRNVYTVDWDTPYASKPITGSNFASFNNSQALNLKSEIFWNPDIINFGPEIGDPATERPGNAVTRKFVRWVLGSDEWDESTGDERWKLGDVFHSGITEVGPPLGTNPHSEYREFKYDNRTRDKIVYVQANDGMLHAFNSETSGDITGGTERWAFIPPNVLGSGRLMGLRGYYVYRNNLKKWRFRQRKDNERVSIPRYLLDGPVVAEDVFIDGSWRTILLNLLGYAGAGMYAVDITDPDKPDFLWAVDNAIYKPDHLDVITDDSDRTISYWVESGDHVGRVNYDHDSTIPPDLDYRQLRFTLSVPSIGSMKLGESNYWVAVMGNGSTREAEPLQDGAVYVMDIESGKILRNLTKTDMKQVVTPITVLNTNSAQRIETFLAGDNNGQIYLWTVGDDWAGKEVFNLEASVGSSYRMDIAELDGDLWLFIITGDYDPLVSTSSDQYFAAVNLESGESYPINRSDLTKLVEEDAISSSNIGWYMEFPQAEEELATTPPLVYNNYVFFSTYKTDPDPCKVGTSRLYVVKAGTGASGWGSESNRYIELSGYRISGITMTGDRVFVGVTDFTGGGGTNLPSELDDLNATQQGNVLIFDVPEPVATSVFPIASGQMRPKYWREWKP